MGKKKVCRSCKMITEEETCPNCKGNQFATSWNGRVFIANPEQSMIAKKMCIAVKGEYAIKVK